MQFLDKNGTQIYPGDLLRSFHFTGARRKRYWLYHVAVNDRGRLRAVPTSYLEPTKINDGGSFLIDDRAAMNCEIISGHGPGDILSFEDRPKRAEQ